MKLEKKMKVTVPLERDTDNSYPGEVSFAEGSGGRYVFITLDRREVAIDREEFLKLCKVFLVELGG